MRTDWRPTGDAGADAAEHGWDVAQPPYDLADVMRQVEGWHILALGRRPRDFMARDLIVGSLLRDERPAGLHQRLRAYARKRPDWLEDAVGHLPGPAQKQAVQLLTVQFFHQRALAKLREYEDPGDDVMDRLQRCWPVGALVEWRGAGTRTPADVCRLPRACPWCFARLAQDVYDRAAAALARTADPSTYLVQLNLSMGMVMVPHDPAWEQAEAAREVGLAHARDPWYMRGGLVNFERKLSREQVLFARKHYGRGAIRGWARALNVTGGVLIHTVGPLVEPDGRRGFGHDLILLGAVRLPDDQAMAAFRKAAYLDRKAPPQVPGPDGERNAAHVLAMPATDPMALRLLLFGSSVGYQWEGLPIMHLMFDVSGERYWLRNGIPGAMYLQPNFMFDPLQWYSHLDATRNLPIVVPFGDWRAAAPSPRLAALAGANLARQTNAKRRRAGLLRAARDVLDSLPQGGGGQKGRPATRRALVQALEAKGFTVSRRDIDCLVQALRPTGSQRS